MTKIFLTMIFLVSIFLLHTLLIAKWVLLDDSYKIIKPKYKKVNCTKYFQLNETMLSRPNCQLIISGEEAEICQWRYYHQLIPNDQTFLESIRQNRSMIIDQYPLLPNSEEEKYFPIAFSISMHRNVYQLERLLKLIYWPQNLYCIHVDRRASNRTKEAVEHLVANFSNVFITHSEPVYWAGYGVLKSVLNCMNDTLTKFGNAHRWKYFLNLSGMDFPLKTNLELVRILKLLNGANDVEFAYEPQFSRYWFSYRSILDSSGNPYTHVPDTRKTKPPPPHNLKIFKGNLAAALSRDFVEYVFSNRIALDFIDWIRDTDTADEHLWSTLNYNLVANAPGSFPVECHNETENLKYFSRYAVWRGGKFKSGHRCAGRYIRDVCIFGVRDLKRLTKADERKELFANKFYIDYQTAAFTCMEEWFRWKSMNKIVQVDENFYSDLPSVKFHERRKLENASQWCKSGNETTHHGNKLPSEIRKLIKGGIVRRNHF